MGNCIDHLIHPSQQERARVLFHGGELEIKPWTSVKKIVSDPYKLVQASQPELSLPANVLLDPGEIDYLVPETVEPQTPLYIKASQEDSCKGQSVKIVLSKKQLQMLLQNRKRIRLEDFLVQFSDAFPETEECQKWHPSLPAIPEVQGY